uniref:Macoilin n=1 Tax=Triatoma infestans TaxID=30076 RepID=A0A023F247_TRIIF
MKRRNGECPKLRRPIKRNKITDGIYGSTIVYVKFFILWVLVLLADFLLEFRFEFLWPFWLLLRSVYDSYKYQGLAFSVFFVSIALTSDMICYFFIPVQWLFFAASTYVWVQYVWHTEKGICFPTVILWLIFAYMEAAVRLKDLRHMPFHLDLCRPFAAHCIGYPVVTLGFGFKSYVSYRIRQRRQRDIRKENGFYMNLLSQALPIEALQSSNQQTSLPEKTKGGSESNGVLHSANFSSNSSGKNSHRKSLDKGDKSTEPYANGLAHQDYEYTEKSFKSPTSSNHNIVKNKPHQQNGGGPGLKMLCFRSKEASSISEKEDGSINCDASTCGDKNSPQGGGGNGGGRGRSKGGGGGSVNQQQQSGLSTGGGQQQGSSRRGKSGANKELPSTTPDHHAANTSAIPNAQKDDYCLRLESEVKRLKSELQSSRQSESELRSQLNSAYSSEKQARGELSSLHHHNEELQAKVQSLSSARASDRANVSSLEKRLAEERRLRSAAEAQLSQERNKAKRATQEAAAAQQAAVQAAQVAAAAAAHHHQQQQQQQQQVTRGDCSSESCRARRREMDTEIKVLRRDLKLKEEICASTDRELQSLIQYKESQTGAEMLMKAVSVLQDKNSHLENSLSAETRIKLDLFSALGEAKRHLEIRDSMIRAQEREIEELKGKMAQVLAVMPSEFGPLTAGLSVSGALVGNGGGNLGAATKLRVANIVATSPDGVPSTLDPNASVYTPKQGHLTTEA